MAALTWRGTRAAESATGPDGTLYSLEGESQHGPWYLYIKQHGRRWRVGRFDDRTTAKGEAELHNARVHA